MNNNKNVWCYYVNVKASVFPRRLVRTPSHCHLSFNISSKTLADCHWYTGKFTSCLTNIHQSFEGATNEVLLRNTYLFDLPNLQRGLKGQFAQMRWLVWFAKILRFVLFVTLKAWKMTISNCQFQEQHVFSNETRVYTSASFSGRLFWGTIVLWAKCQF